MKAMVFRGVRDLRLEDVEKPQPRRKEVLVRVAYCGVCKTDIHIFTGAFPAKPPVILGHEFSGVVEELGEDVKTLKRGDHVAVNPIVYCGECKYCVQGRTNLCENAVVLGGAGEIILDGAYAEYVRVPEKNALRIDPEVSLKHAAMTEPLACVVHGIELIDVKPGDRVVVIGAGPIGLMLAQMAKNSGSSKVLVMDLRDERLKVAEKVGVDITVNPLREDPLRAVEEATQGEKADIVIEAVGSIKTVEDSFKYVKKGGKVLIFGVPPEGAPARIIPFDIYFKEISVIGSYAVPAESFIKAASIISGKRVDLDPLITEVYPLERLREAFEKAEKGEGLKKLIEVRPS